MRCLLLSIIFFAMLTQCTFSERSEVPHRQSSAPLTQIEADWRGKLISNVKYDMSFDLTTAESFTGKVKIQFQLSKEVPLNIDFIEGKVTQVLVNGHNQEIKYNNFFVSLEKTNLVKGNNEVVFEFSHPYSRNGSGLYRYVDPEDKKVYLYSDFEPFDANLMFPCFDQPDLKANYTLHVKVPKEWVVISSTRESQISEEGTNKIWNFPESAKFSTYLISLHAGEYKMWESQVKTKSLTIPLRLFARQSWSKYVKPEDWFLFMGQALSFYEDYFSYPYPYKKYDQILVPDFNSGAMENVAAVTFNETRYISRGEQPLSQRRQMASTIFHEIAHMWFGDLVTMKWWNDLWLNESFATFAAAKGLASKTEFKNNWLHFLNAEKPWAYWTDQLPTTHPIETPVSATDQAFTNFDGISYGKGASVIKQLNYYVGEEGFQKGLQLYFKTFAEQNTTRENFTSSIEKASGKPMKEWSEKWLQTAQVNTIEPSIKCENGKVVEFSLQQTFVPAHPVLRAHKTEIGFFNKSKGKMELTKKTVLEYKDAVTLVPSLVGESCPDVIISNWDDQDYVKMRLDELSLAKVKENLSLFSDPMARSLLWTSLWEMVLDQKIKPQDYIEIVFNHGLSETDYETLNFVVEHTRTIFAHYLPEDTDELKAKRTQMQNSFEAAYLLKMNQTKSNPEFQKVWFREFVAMSESENAQKILFEMLGGGYKGLAFSIDQDKRWELIHRLSALGHAQARALISEEKAKDASGRGEKSSVLAEALFPQKESKQVFLNKIHEGLKKVPLEMMRAMMGGLFHSRQKSLSSEFEGEVLTKVAAFNESTGMEYMKEYLKALLPMSCTPKTALRLNEITKSQRLPTLVDKMLKNAAYENERCVNIQNFSKQAI